MTTTTHSIPEIVNGLRLYSDDGGDFQPAIVTYLRDRPHDLRITLLDTHLQARGCVYIARDLVCAVLAGGTALVGCDQVQIGPSGQAGRVLLRVRDGDGRWMDFHADRCQLQAIVDATLELVPSGNEHVDIDGALAALLTRGA
ncbi:SsgA family sporulation/cell division regulator [Planobispora siamensis]|uniref:Uncharacterized protein n=1 Tax=Planobispora siamensis TaxID=936338 RepID=A0A8J3SLE7_9ACTN|nr:SsgA family sporulation/cell division regulator [Planobispora siamensis]GIH95310.1 hypothetical protein Psi01_59400 [Planobispora siamensis]